MKEPAFLDQLVKVGLQVLVFDLAGGFVKFLIDRAAELRNFRSEILRRLGNAHRTVYRVRRLLEGVDKDKRGQLLGELMDARQDLGSVYHDVRVTRLLEPRARKEVRNKIKSMREYLEDVIEAAIIDDAAKQNAYTEFVDFRGSRRYEEEFKDRYFSAKELVDPRFKRAESDELETDAPREADTS